MWIAVLHTLSEVLSSVYSSVRMFPGMVATLPCNSAKYPETVTIS